ncbi:MAG: hypothetical protein HRT58_05610 [Crocinitomicaceae bacterium]|nr:hypothetical protein [Flavobacteriales bacterium]NQZ35117.1 hypothetical protein [Crocinitomicaceae bacterium]
MEIETRKSASESILESAKIVWKSYAKGFSKFYLIFGSLSCLLIVYGIFDYDSATIMMWNSQYHLYLHLSLVIGIGLLFTLLYVLMIMNKSKRAYFQDANDHALKHKEIDSIFYRLTDKSFTRDTQLTNSTTNWELFASKEVIGDFVILHLSRSPLNAFVINCEFLDTVQKEKLDAVLDEKIRK